MTKNLIATAFFILACLPAWTQEGGKFFIEKFNREDYSASFSNWKAVHDNRGILYFANFDGVLQYDGNKWRLITMPDNSMVWSIAVGAKNRIYIGINQDFGYLKPSASGQLAFTSLKSHIPPDTRFQEVRDILPTTEGVFFYTHEAIFRWDGKNIKLWRANKGKFNRAIFQHRGKVFCMHSKLGLVQLGTDGIIPVPDTQFLIGSNITVALPYPNGGKMLGSEDKGLFLFKAGKISKLNTPLSSFVEENILVTGQAFPKSTDTGGYVLGTGKGGLAVTDSTFTNYKLVNAASGFKDPAVIDLCFDNSHNLWVAMKDGIARVELLSGWRFWDESMGLPGTVWSSLKMYEHLYVGTSKGLFYLDEGRFRQSPNITSKVWCMLDAPIGLQDRTLLVGTKDALYQIDDRQQEKRIPGWQRVQVLTPSLQKENTVIVGHNQGVSLLEYKDGAYQKAPLLKVNSNTYYSITEDDEGNIWASSKFLGIYWINKYANRYRKARLFTKKHGLPDVNEISIINHEGNLLFATGKGFYKLNPNVLTDSSNLFVEDRSLIPERVKVNWAKPGKNGEYYLSVIDKNRVERLEKLVPTLTEGTSSYKRVSQPYRRLPEMEIQSVYTELNGHVWVCASDGLFHFNENLTRNFEKPFQTLIRQVATSNDSIIFRGAYVSGTPGSLATMINSKQPLSAIPTLNYQHNTVIFDYTATTFELPHKNVYSYLLEGSEEEWSPWTQVTRKEYNHLPAGSYTFHVKAQSIYGALGQTSSFSFHIQPPWYQTTWAYLMFSALTLLTVWVIALLYSYQMRQQRRKLKLIVADRTYEVISQKKEIELQHTLLKERSDKILQQRDHIKKKNAALENSQKEILDMNHKLQEMNLMLEKEVEARTSKINATFKQLKRTNEELDTFVYRASHDLKSPVSRIIGLASLAHMEKEEPGTQYLDLIELAAYEMKALLAKLASVHEILNKEASKAPIDLTFLTKKAIKRNQHLEKRGGEVACNFQSLEEIAVVTDEFLISIILENLIENALIFRKQGSSSALNHEVNLHIHSNSTKLYILINDTGIGIQESLYTKVYNMFFRGSELSKGSGLGLYLVKLAIEKLDGEIEVNSKEGEFTQFKVSIPV